jgi:hypothetical protein
VYNSDVIVNIGDFGQCVELTHPTDYRMEKEEADDGVYENQPSKVNIYKLNRTHS